ncbi:MAG TPA: M6 family metalloprotease domain-containing protein, partial [candidate division Zixibacteria bacterium]|nr:M6 family metalloprotease domain-containing protein [candidate division Zixibacteria bacterium]
MFSTLSTTRLRLTLILLGLMALSVPQTAPAVDYHPAAKELLRKENQLAANQRGFAEAHAAGLCTPNAAPLRTPSMLKRLGIERSDALGRTLATGAKTVDTVKVLVILVDFDDNPYNASVGPNVSNVSATPAMFDSVLFSTGNLDGGGITNPTGSMTEYYIENSYGNFFIQGVIAGWYRMPRNYSEYVGSNNGLQPRMPGVPNAQDLALDAINAADFDVDFALFDQYGPGGVPDGLVDGVFVVHAGMGNEDSYLGGFNDIHSHKWNIPSAVNKDGVLVYNYTMEPEESYINSTISSIGVFCHEYGHFIGLPDLYDTDGAPPSSDGLGAWSLMASGNWLGNSRTPSHFDAWSKVFVGFTTPVILTENLRNVSLPQAEDSAVAYLLKGKNLPAGEYFLVENRQKTKFDQYLPGSGLLIYHVDQAANPISNNNDNENRYLVALEQADGKNDLALTVGNDGDAGDPFSSRDFHDLTVPNSRSNGVTEVTEVAVWDISPSGAMMTANLDISFSRPYLELLSALVLDQSDGDGVIEPNEHFNVEFAVRNRWATGQNAWVKIVSTSPHLNFGTDSLDLGSLPGNEGVTVSPDPFTFTVASSLVPRIDTLYFEFHSDDEANVISLALEIEVGAAQYLLVNADKAGANGQFYTGDLRRARIPSRTHTISSQGPPTGNLLKQYPNVIWFYGDTTATPPNPAQIQALKEFLNAGGNLMISGQNLAEHLHTVDSAFMFDYLHAVDGGSNYSVDQYSVSGSPISDGLKTMRFFGNGGANNWVAGTARALKPANGGDPALDGRFTPDTLFHAVSYSGDHKVVFFSLPFEALENQNIDLRTQRNELFGRVLNFFGD